MTVGFALTDWLLFNVREGEKTPWGAVGHQRVGQYLPYLDLDYKVGALVFSAEVGHFGILDVERPGMFPNKSDPQEHTINKEDVDWDCELIYVLRNMNVNLPGEILQARSHGQVIIQDLDDVIWNVDKRNVSHAHLEDANHTFEAYFESLRNSNAVICSTDYIRDHIAQYNDRVATIGNFVDVDRFRTRKHMDVPARVGWVGSTALRSGDLDILQPFADRYQWVHGGHQDHVRPFTDMVGIEKAIIHPTRLPRDYPEVFKFDVGVAPLSNVEFNLGKSYLKGLEYAAAGIPFVASNFGEYKKLHERGIGLLADTPDEWVGHLDKLVNDFSYRKDIADQNNELIKKFDIKVAVPLFQSFLEAAKQLS